MHQLHRTHRLACATGVWLLSIVLVVLPAAAQDQEANEHATETEAEATTHEEHGEESEHHGHDYHRNLIGLFVGATDEEGHDPELTLGFEYERRLSQRWGVGAFSNGASKKFCHPERSPAVIVECRTLLPMTKIRTTTRQPGQLPHKSGPLMKKPLVEQASRQTTAGSEMGSGLIQGRRP